MKAILLSDIWIDKVCPSLPNLLKDASVEVHREELASHDQNSLLEFLSKTRADLLFFSDLDLSRRIFSKKEDYLSTLRQNIQPFFYSILLHPIRASLDVRHLSADDFLPLPCPPSLFDSVLRRAEGGKARILVSEDDRVLRSILKRKLEKLGYDLVLCQNGLIALDKTLEVWPDVVVSDVKMPAMGGFELCKSLKDNPWTQHIPVLLTSGLTELDDIEKGLSLGASDYVTKPYDFADISQKLRFYLTRRGRERKTVLIVDDSRMLRELMKIPLQQEGFIVYTAANGKEGLEVISRFHPDVVVTDFTMPEMDGWEFCRRIKENVSTAEIPVIMVSAKTSDMDRKIGRSLKVREYLTKPCQPKTLVNAINYVLLEKLAEEQKKEKEKLEGQLQVGREIQACLLPLQIEGIRQKLKIKSGWVPALQLGGDFFDFLPFEDQSGCMFAIADVSGKGLPAALVAVGAQASLRTSSVRSRQPGEILTNLNDYMIRAQIPEETFLTCFIAVMDFVQKKLFYSCAGHQGMFLLRRNQLIELSVSGLPCGIMEKQKYSEGELGLEVGDKLILYTDGVIEATGSEGELYSTQRLQGILQNEGGKLSCEDLHARIMQDIHQFTLSQPQSDDITLVIAQYLEG